MSYVVAVPSYKRPDAIGKKTLATLGRLGVDPRIVTVYVATEAERDVYFHTMPHGLYGHIEVTAPGLGPSRNEIMRRHEKDQAILFCDDDINELLVRVDEKTIRPLANGSEFIEQAFETTHNFHMGLWGVYAVKNPYFMKPTVSNDLKYINGTFYGVFNTHDEDMFVSLTTKEDWERSIKFYLRDGGVVRFNYVATLTRYYDEPGGLHDLRTEEITVANCHELVRRYPLLCSLNTTKASGHMEVRLRDRRVAKAR